MFIFKGSYLYLLLYIYIYIYLITALKPLHSKLHFLGTLGRVKLLFTTKSFLRSTCIYVFLFCPKNSRTGILKSSITREWLNLESLRPLLESYFLFPYQFVYNLSSNLNDLILACSAQLQLCLKVSHQWSGFVYVIFLFLKQ